MKQLLLLTYSCSVLGLSQGLEEMAGGVQGRRAGSIRVRAARVPEVAREGNALRVQQVHAAARGRLQSRRSAAGAAPGARRSRWPWALATSGCDWPRLLMIAGASDGGDVLTVAAAVGGIWPGSASHRRHRQGVGEDPVHAGVVPGEADARAIFRGLYRTRHGVAVAPKRHVEAVLRGRGLPSGGHLDLCELGGPLAAGGRDDLRPAA